MASSRKVFRGYVQVLRDLGDLPDWAGFAHVWIELGEVTATTLNELRQQAAAEIENAIEDGHGGTSDEFRLLVVAEELDYEVRERRLFQAYLRGETPKKRPLKKKVTKERVRTKKKKRWGDCP